MGIADGCLSQGKYGDNLRAVVMHNDEEHPHLHFYVYSDTEVNAKMLHDGHKNASRKGSYKAGVQAFRMSISRKSLAGAAWPAPGKAPPPLACRMARGAENVDVDSEGGECGARFRSAA